MLGWAVYKTLFSARQVFTNRIVAYTYSQARHLVAIIDFCPH